MCVCVCVFINGDLSHVKYPGLGPVLIKQNLTAVPPPGSSQKFQMFDTLYSMSLSKMLLNLYLNANFDVVLRS